MAMVVVLLAMVAAAAVGGLALAVWWAAEMMWFRPRRLERALMAQGLIGSRYQFPSGDLKKHRELVVKARQKPIPLSHRIIPRAVPQLIHNWELYGDKNKMSFFWFGSLFRVVVKDPEVIKDVLCGKLGHLEKPKINPFFKKLVTGLLSYNGDKWAKHKKIVNPAFHVEKLKRMMPAFLVSCDELINGWEDLAGSSGKCELNVWPEFQNFAADVISRTAFGSGYKEGRQIFELQKEQSNLVIHAVQTSYFPGFSLLPTKRNRRINEIYREVPALLASIIESRERAISNGEACPDDLLGLLMESNQKQADEHEENPKDVMLTMQEVIEECKLFYFAGQETTAVLLTWTMVVLSMHQNWQDKAREEVLQVFGQNKPNFEGLHHLKIVTMILYEVLRLYSPVTHILRQVYKETKLGEFTLPPGVQVLIPIIFLHHSKEYWGDDTEEFNPERFANGISNATKSRLVFFPFGWGPRICMGQSFAVIEAKMALARILQLFFFELSSSYAHAPLTTITLQPQHGAQVILHKL
ncbi:hypothetical protein HPP92_023274 [Vanilla planifolia]|uniref:Cytochrome P450 n=1 Tax=Vanilla planifolia TaxID=51239 RepID=A0A835PV64_VANPL|nr:hypothetical protein HPP92_023274 [Vanilla planifolia]